ncbi:DNA-processing protein DprA [Myroides odoratimimus]|uniref:DNA-processing protein DprA n=1 Tax=Myroides odoratimimus TaxID=76832 RepID=UPI002576E897|nr:DNA-processing protein DprA [Myroides odoratimimus]MDM1065800.1 DNA-protecting protein DprA [Myroides odoratimimus]MDM1464029.1 DNA-protecting protein DprA [Myroides odoratimimus]MDM1473909.1 DNA-protecting protein DprA [Myroides odoratimimus]
METLFDRKENFISYFSPITEMAAYESIWSLDRSISFKKIADKVNENNNLLSDLIDKSVLENTKCRLKEYFENKKGFNFNFIFSKSFNYPIKLKDAKEPIEMFYYRGNLDLLYEKSIAIVGSRHPSEEGIRRARKLTKLLVENNFVIISGLASGIDTVAHETAIKSKGKTIAVIGTPIDTYYPKENKILQDFISLNHLLVSQVPFLRYSEQTYRGNKLFFPERNKTMSAISEATVIIEASDTSGTLIQARAAIEQGRKLFILQSCFENKSITWPEKYEKMGAKRVRKIEDLIDNL